MNLRFRLAGLIFITALLVRLGLLFTSFDHLQHGSAGAYGSAALGILHQAGLTVNQAEALAIRETLSNVSGDFRTKYAGDPRLPLTEFLPGPAVLLAGLWSAIPIYNFAPYLALQALIDALLIATLGFLLARKNLALAVITAGVMVVNLPVIRRTLMMGYDFWPQFGVLVLFIGVLALEAYRYKPWMFLLIGISASISVWCRELTTPLPFFIAVLLIYVLRTRESMAWMPIAGRIVLLIGPVVLSIVMLAQFRFEATGNYRPTRSTFWHSFMAGVGQFSNPYGIINDDMSVWAFTKRVNPELEGQSLAKMYLMPDSPYERTLKGIAIEFITQHSLLFVRNIIYRAAIIISPPLYRDGDFIPKPLTNILYPIGILLIPLWFAGMNYLRRNSQIVFGLTLTIYIYFVLAFGWFYVVGRVVLPILFISVMVWVSGIYFVKEWIEEMRRIQKSC